MTRQVVLDTETTGIDPKDGHRIIEIGCVEMIERRLTGNTFHEYIQPDREIEKEAMEVHGITNEYLEDKPRFADIAERMVEFLSGAELIIHNAAFDIGHLNAELARLPNDSRKVEDFSQVTCSLIMARKMFPGQRVSLDALSKRFDIRTAREKHGALLDSEILADVFLAMTGGQKKLSLDAETEEGGNAVVGATVQRVTADLSAIPVIKANDEELLAHEERLDIIAKASGNQVVWRTEPS